MEADMKTAIEDCCRRANVSAAITQSWEFGNEVFDDPCAELVRTAAADLGVSWRNMLSQAGHDAYNMSRVTPTALLFSPCKDGISHNESEEIELGYTAPAVNVLLHSVLARANR
jgi:N-carbamoyl-L-amino-acid hydrolase